MESNRIARVIENMRARGLDQIVVSSTPSVYYLTGRWISPGERMLALYINMHGDVVLFANRLFAQAAEPGLELVEYGDMDDPVSMLAARVRSGRLGIDKDWPSRFTIGLMEKKPGLVPALGSAPVDDARMCKDTVEIERMRESSRLNDRALSRALGLLCEGMTETELQNVYEKCAREAGGEGLSFTPIACFGANCAEPHHDSNGARLQKGDAVILDVGLLKNRYCSDMTRTVFFSSATDEQRKVYDVCRRANEAGRAAVRPGVPMREFDRAARRVIEDAGYGKYFVHRTGHGIGLDVHEYPDNSATSEVVAKPGMCFSVEPGIYLPGKFGVRVEDLVVVTPDGAETLNALSRDFQIV